MSAAFQMPTAAELGCFVAMKPASELARDPLSLSDEDLIVEVLREAGR